MIKDGVKAIATFGGAYSAPLIVAAEAPNISPDHISMIGNAVGAIVASVVVILIEKLMKVVREKLNGQKKPDSQDKS